MIFPTEAGHWYKPDGEPAYTVLSTKGEPRDTTLRDARKYDYGPSVTTILQLVRSAGLEVWKQKNLLLAALTLPRKDDETLDEFAQRVIDDADKQRADAAMNGRLIHGSVELAMCGQWFPQAHAPHVKGVLGLLTELFPDATWRAERSFYRDGYGGKVDLFSEDPPIVVDFKAKDFEADKKPARMAFPNYGMQLAAYGHGVGLSNPRMFNFFISTRVPGLVLFHEWENGDDLLKQFLTLFEYWKLDKNYTPPTG